MKKRVVSVLVILLLMLLIGTVNSAYADERAVEIIEGLTVDEDTAVPLYNSEDDISAYYIEGNDNGYIILDNECNVVEFSYQGDIDDFEDSDTDCYYGGPGNYYVESENEDNTLINVSSDEKVEKDDIENFETEYDINEENGLGLARVGEAKKSATITLPDGISYSNGKRTYTSKYYNVLTLKSKKTLPYHSRYFDYNDNNTCGSTAAAILTYYYYDHVAKSYIKSNKYKKGNDVSQEAFVKLYRKLIGDKGKGANDWQVKDGINKYLKSIGKKENCRCVSKHNILYTVFSQITDKINHKRPCIVGLNKEPKYGDHWVVGIGYAIFNGHTDYGRGSEVFIKINNGWGESFSQNVTYVNYKYVDCVIYLK